MGATLYLQTIETARLKETFNDLVAEAIYEYGNDSYNGTISTTSLESPITIIKSKSGKYTKTTQKAFDKMWNEDDEKLYKHFSKWSTTPINLGLVGYQGYKPLWVANTQPTTKVMGRKLIKKFRISSGNVFDSIADAKKYAKKRALNSKENVTIEQLYDNGQRKLLGTMKLVETGNMAKSLRTVQNKVYLPVYHYELAVYAAC